MKRLILTTLLAFAFGIGLALLTAAPSMAVHKGSGDLTCGACHTMHSSQGGTSAPSMGDGSGGATGSGSFILLRTSVTDRSQLHNFCLQCHSQNGAQKDVINNGAVAAGQPGTTPPKVHLTGTTSADLGWDGVDFTTTGGGGLFNGGYSPGAYILPTADDGTSGNNALGKQHSIGAADATPPGNSINGSSTGIAIGPLSCTTCHDPHGTNLTNNNINRYRNLKAGSSMPANAQNKWTNMGDFGDLATSYVGGVTNSGSVANNFLGTNPSLANNLWPVWRDAGTQNSYITVASGTVITLGGNNINAAVDGSANNVGFSAFCAQCHGAWHEGVTTNNNISTVDARDWKRHPVNNSLVATTEVSGAGVNIVDFTHYNSRESAASGQGQAPFTTTDATRLPAANVTDAGGVRYYADDGTDKVFCLSCHFSHGSRYYDILRWDYTSAVAAGSQTGNAIASNVGCQQCHNR